MAKKQTNKHQTYKFQNKFRRGVITSNISHSSQVTIILKRIIVTSNQVKSNYDIPKNVVSFTQNLTSTEDKITHLAIFYIDSNYESC